MYTIPLTLIKFITVYKQCSTIMSSSEIFSNSLWYLITINAIKIRLETALKNKYDVNNTLRRFISENLNNVCYFVMTQTKLIVFGKRVYMQFNRVFETTTKLAIRKYHLNSRIMDRMIFYIKMRPLARVCWHQRSFCGWQMSLVLIKLGLYVCAKCRPRLACAARA